MASPKGTTPTIDITINDDGEFAYSVSTRLMARNPKRPGKFRTVKWSSKGPFVIDFGDRSPFQVLTLKGRKNRQGSYESGAVVVERSAPLGRYRYAVAVCKDDEVFLDACPEVVVEC
jgi:hypothetical protein